jgi:endonuclease/exonuclease/phosphatase family metal-dependent hydrolase
MEASCTIISSNIRFSTSDDGPHRWENRCQLLAKILLSHRPAIVGTQEGREPQLRELADLLSPLTLVAEGRPWIPERMYPCIFVDPKLVEVLENGDFWLSETPHVPGSASYGSAFPRLCTWARIRLRGENVLVASTHLDHVLSETRNRQSTVLATQLRNLLRPGEKLLLLGDFNDEPSSTARSIILDLLPELRDPWLKPEESSHHPFSGSCPTGSRIDWILVSKEIKVEDVFLEKSNEHGKWPSDHFPVVCRIKA